MDWGLFGTIILQVLIVLALAFVGSAIGVAIYKGIRDNR